MITPRLTVVRPPMSQFNGVQSVPAQSAAAPVRAAASPQTLPRPAASPSPASEGGLDARKLVSVVMELLQKLFSLFQGGAGNTGSGADAPAALGTGSSPEVASGASPSTANQANPVTSPEPAPAPRGY